VVWPTGGSGGKKSLTSCEAISSFTFVVPAAVVMQGILAKDELLVGSKKRAACHMLVASSRKSCQWALFCFLIDWW
jgi:hypothetical protein